MTRATYERFKAEGLEQFRRDLAAERRYRDALREDIAGAPAWRVGTPWHDDRLAAIAMADQSIARLEALLARQS